MAKYFVAETSDWVEWYVQDANGRIHGPWSHDVCRRDVASGEGGVQIIRRRIQQEIFKEFK